MTKIYLVRHGEAEGNLYRRCQGWYDSLLTKKAVDRQLPALRKRFSEIRLDAVYSSDILRAYQTVLPIACEHGLTVFPDPGLREMNLGDWEDHPWGELPRIYPKQMDAWDNHPWEACIPGGETYVQAERRFRRTILKIARRHEGETILIGTHGSVTRAILSTSLYGTLKGMKKIGWCDNTAVALLSVEDKKIAVEFYNDNSHLTPESSTLGHQKWWRDGDRPADFNLWFKPVDLDAHYEMFLFYGREFLKNAYGEETKFDAENFLLESRRIQDAYPRALLFAMLREREYGLLRIDTEASQDAEGCGLIKTVVVCEEARGRGYAQQLLGEAVSVYRRMGRKSICVNVADGNSRATCFYEKHGFLCAGKMPGHTVMKKDIEVINPVRK